MTMTLPLLRRRRRTAAAGPWNPATGQSFGTLLARYRADVITELWTDSARTIQVSADTDPVGAWDDVTAAAAHLTQATGADRPIYRTNQQNSLPGIVCNGINQFLQRAFSMFPAGGKHVVFIVMKTPTAPAGDIAFDTSTDAGIDRRTLSIAAAGITLARDGGGGSIVNNGFTDGDTLLFTGVLNGASSLTRINNANEVTGTISADATASTSPFRLGTRYESPAGAQFYQGTFYELLFYSLTNEAALATGLTYNYTGLKAKWGLP